MAVLYVLAVILYVIACVFLIVIVLFRKSEGSALGSAFGVGGDSPFGVKTQQALDKIAMYASIALFAIAIFLSLYPKLTGQQAGPRTPTPLGAPSDSAPEDY
jgi:protein translocase SecG subunit